MLGPKAFVSTYKKYNEGRLEGEWVNLDEFKSYDEFIEYCRKLHWEDVPKQFISESYIDKELWDWLNLDDNERFITKLYWDKVNRDAGVQTILDNYYGEFNSIGEFGEYMADKLFYDVFKKYPDLEYYFDYDFYAKDLLMNDFVDIKYDNKYYIFYCL